MAMHGATHYHVHVCEFIKKDMLVERSQHHKKTPTAQACILEAAWRP